MMDDSSPVRSTLAPGFLIAMPQLLDPNFYRTVVLLLEHNEHGSLGLVINQASGLTMAEFATAQEIPYKGDAEKPVYVGGPVEQEMGWILHPTGVHYEDTHEVQQGVSVSRSVTALKDVCGKGEPTFRLLMGYAGWGPGQLESELTQGAWVTSNIDAELVFAQDPGDVWELSLRNMGINPATLVPGGSAIN